MDNTVVIEQTSYVNVDTVRDTTVNIDNESTVLVTNTNTGTVIQGNNGLILQVTSEFNTPIIGGAQGPQGIPGEEDMPYSKRVDFISDTELYKGEAVVGSSENASVWRVHKIVLGVDGDMTETWASGNANFDKVWADRAGLSYS